MKISRNLTGILLLCAALNAHASDGREGGGGDPVAAEFTFTMAKIGDYLQARKQVLPELDRSKMKALIHEFVVSLDSTSKVETVEERPVDPHGIKKAAVFSTNPLSIEVHRQTWQQSPASDRVALAGMELLGLLGVRNGRYEKAIADFADHSEQILGVMSTAQVTSGTNFTPDQTSGYLKWAHVERTSDGFVLTTYSRWEEPYGPLASYQRPETQSSIYHCHGSLCFVDSAKAVRIDLLPDGNFVMTYKNGKTYKYFKNAPIPAPVWLVQKCKQISSSLEECLKLQQSLSDD